MNMPEELIKQAFDEEFEEQLLAIRQSMSYYRCALMEVEDIYDLANYFLKQDDVHLIETKDYIQHPKPNGYRSLHLIVEIPIFLANEKKWVKVEVQFRTIAMNFWASLEHKLRYKKELSQERLAEIDSELLECAKLCATLDQKMQNIKGSKLAQEL